jgi:hypothetical protein
VWKSWKKDGLDIKDIVWPGNTHSPPQGVPEKFHLKITFLEEPPYINLAPPDPVTGKCTLNKGVFCRYASATDLEGYVPVCWSQVELLREAMLLVFQISQHNNVTNAIPFPFDLKREG